MSQSAAENEADMLERVPVPAGPLPVEYPAFPAADAIASPRALARDPGDVRR